MSEADSAATALGKRPREDEAGDTDGGDGVPEMPPPDMEDSYYKSFMHRDTINFVTMTKTDFVLTTSVDGHLKFWKKQEQGIEFVKHYRTSLKAVVGVSASEDGVMYATISEDGQGRVFDVVNFDMINILKFSFRPKTCCWIHEPGAGQTLLAVTDMDTPTIRIYDGRGDGKPLYELDKLHRAPVHLMAYTSKYDCVISADEQGFVEYWQPSEPWTLPSLPGLWQFKSSTDLFHFKKTKSIPTSLTFSPNSSQFVTLALPSRAVHVFNFLTGKLTRTYDESLQATSEMQQAGTAVHKLDDMDFGRRLAQERELDASQSGPGGLLRTANAVWDESGNFVLYPTMLGIKVVNTVTNKVARLIGKDESLRFLNLAVYQGAPAKKGVTTLAMAASANPLLQEKANRDPHLFATAYNKSRFYLFARADVEAKGERDVFNERPTREEQTVALAQQPEKVRAQATMATIHTSKGDIHLKLFPDIAPKTVENFVTHIKNGYYNNLIFHRVIRKFSCWGGEFEDEISPKQRFSQPYILAMANAGPGTNGSQFFITTVPTPHLNDKHTIFGKAVGGLEVIHSIEQVPVDKNDKPWDPVIMHSLECS
ncbi:Cyclophilin cyp15 [Saitozyma sp. JCM 24511]|nr:Cyclophilin cyp15 [Saitozyma sp. JCM 24511]